jgi:Fic family protein
VKIPLTPPPLLEILSKAPNALSTIFADTAPLVDGQYLHWDQLRHRPPPYGRTSELWWATIRRARGAILHSLPLLAKDGRPFQTGMPEPVLIHLHHIDREAAGHVQSSTQVTTPEHRTRYLIRSLMEEAISSSQLEGAATTRKVAEAMLREGRKPRDHSEQMIFNNYQAMKAIQQMQGTPITPEGVLELHRLLTEGTLDDATQAGRLRRSDDIRVVDHRDGTILHQPPHHVELSERMERLCAFANADETARPFVHPVLRAILLHFMIGYDHPFVDGNGRTARALFYWSMAQSGYWLTEFVSISHFLRRAPAEYVRAYLYTETDDNDTTYFVLHQLEVIRKAVAALHEYLDRVAQEQRSTERLLAASPSIRARLNHRQIALLTHALKHPGAHYLVEAHQRSHGVVYQTARTDLLALAALGLLIKGQAGRTFVFTAPADLRTRIAEFAEPAATAGAPKAKRAERKA